MLFACCVFAVLVVTLFRKKSLFSVIIYTEGSHQAVEVTLGGFFSARKNGKEVYIMVLKITPKQRTKINALVRKTCCNCYKENCLLLDDGKEHFFINISLDTARQRAFITDSKAAEVLVVDTHNGNILAKVAAPESLAVLFNPARNEAYVTHRQAGKVSVIDAKSYKVVKTFDTPTHPNSLALSADGKTLYVSVKQKSTKQQEATQPDDVIRIAL